MLYDAAVVGCNIKKMYDTVKEHEGRFFTYVLLLQQGRLYVGSTDNIYTRLYDHFTCAPSSAIWVKEYGPPIRVVEIIKNSKPHDEHQKFVEYASKFGFDVVRGAGYCRLSLREPPCIRDYIPHTTPIESMSRNDIDTIVDRVKMLM